MKIRTILLAAVLIELCTHAHCFDALHFEDGREPVKCRVEALGDDFLVARVVREKNGKQTLSKTVVKLTELAFVDFERSRLDVQLQEQASDVDYEKLRLIWKEKSKWLDVKRSNAGAYGIAVAERLLASGEPSKQKVALATFEEIEDRDWNESRRLRAQQGRLKSLLALGHPEEALAEATAIAESAEQPEILVETKLVMAMASRRRLEDLLEDNPKWRDDDEVRDQVRRALDDTIDQFLFPSLFHGSLEHASARGLWNVIEIFGLADDEPLASQCAMDLLALYPDSDDAGRARRYLETMDRN